MSLPGVFNQVLPAFWFETDSVQILEKPFYPTTVDFKSLPPASDTYPVCPRELYQPTTVRINVANLKSLVKQKRRHLSQWQSFSCRHALSLFGNYFLTIDVTNLVCVTATYFPVNT